MKQTKAERLFENTYIRAFNRIKIFGIDYDQKKFGQRVIGWTGFDTEESISNRTLNAIEKIAQSEFKSIDISERLNVIDKERAEMKRLAVEIVIATIANVRKRL